MRQTRRNGKYQFRMAGTAAMPLARCFRLSSLTRDDLGRFAGAADLKRRARGIIDHPRGYDDHDQQPEQILTDAVEHRGRGFSRLALTARSVRQYLAISVEFLGQHRSSTVVSPAIYVATDTGKTIVGTCNVGAGTAALFCGTPWEENFNYGAPNPAVNGAGLSLRMGPRGRFSRYQLDRQFDQ